MENNANIQVNFILQACQERLNEVTSQLVLKDAIIKQLTLYINELETNSKTKVKEKEKEDDF